MSPNGNVQATIGGNVQGQVAVGNYILQVGDVSGGIVNVAPPSEKPKYTRREDPANLRPRSFPSLLDRDDETATVLSALKASSPVSLFGPPGMGKTSLLRSLAHAPETDAFLDGVVYLTVSNLGVDDVLQSLFDAFNESHSNFKPTNAETRLALQNIRALIMLDDLSLSRDEASALLDAAPNCTFVLAGVERSLWGEGQILSLEGLPLDDALDLFVLELNRSLSKKEQAEVREICALLHGHPLRILHNASSVREKTASISDLKNQLQQDSPSDVAVQNALDSSSDSEKNLVAILAAAGGIGVPVRHLETLSESNDLKSDMGKLVSLGLVEELDNKISLVGDLSSTVAKLWDLTSWEDRLIEVLVEWLLKKPAKDALDDSVDVLVHSIQKAGEKNRWRAVMQIGRGLERTLVLWRRWQTWLDILNLILKAARALGDRKVEAWAMHQIGTRAACLGYNEPARGFLTQALKIRKAIGDKAGLEITKHNMTAFKFPISGTGCSRCFTWGAAGVGSVIAVSAIITAIVVGMGLIDNRPEPTQTPIVREVIVSETPRPATDTPIPTITPTFTSTPTITPTPRPVVEIRVENLTSLERAVLYQGLKQDHFRVPVSITITNLASIEIEGSVVTFYYEDSDGVRQVEFLPSGDIVHVGSLDISSLRPGEIEVINGYMIIPSYLGGNLVGLLASLDQCDTDFDCEFIFSEVSLPFIVYDFVDSSPAAKWIGYDPGIDKEYDLIFNGPSPDPSQGTVGLASDMVLEDGSRPYYVLSTHPTWVSDGEIEGLYLNFGEEPSIFISKGDRLVTRVGFIGGGGGDGVTFRVVCIPPGSFESMHLQSMADTSDGRLVDTVFVFTNSVECGVIDFLVRAGPSSGQDWAVWVAAYIERP